MPKKHRAIEGVGASSILELKAQLYKSQEESKRLNGPDVEYHRAKKRIAPRDTFSLKNSGVDARVLKDKLELKALEDGSASYAALEKKAELYDKLVRGELLDEEDQEKYCVDFFRKGVKQEESQQPQVDHASDNLQTGGEDGESDDGPFFHTRFLGPRRTAGIVYNDEHKRFVRFMKKQIKQGKRCLSLNCKGKEQAVARREKLRQAYLRKQLEKLKAA